MSPEHPPWPVLVAPWHWLKRPAPMQGPDKEFGPMLPVLVRVHKHQTVQAAGQVVPWRQAVDHFSASTQTLRHRVRSLVVALLPRFNQLACFFNNLLTHAARPWDKPNPSRKQRHWFLSLVELCCYCCRAVPISSRPVPSSHM
jgi:hypothetical protein